ncbi:MAG: ice-binding family protein [Balneolales bacterium]
MKTSSTISHALQYFLQISCTMLVISMIPFIAAFAQTNLSAPADAAIAQPQDLTLVWHSYAGTDVTYNFILSEDNIDYPGTPGTEVLNQLGIADTILLVTDLNKNQTYHWQVGAKEGDSAYGYSETWVFTTWDSLPKSPSPPVNLGTAGEFVILAKTAISTVPESEITGDIGVSPSAATSMTGFDFTDDVGFATSSQLNGKAYAANMLVPTPAKMTAAISDMETAFTDAAGRAIPDFTEWHIGSIGGNILIPGLYKWSGNVEALSGFEISGGENDIWIFQIAEDLTLASDVMVTLSGGAQAQNIFWQVSGSVSIGTNSHFEGIILSMTAITLKDDATINGRLLAQSAVTLDKNIVTEPTNQTTNINHLNDKLIPVRMILNQNYPNPFNPTTSISFELPEQTVVRLAIHDMLGREVAVLVSESRSAGFHQVTWNAQSVPSGMYLYRLSANGQILTGKMMMIK